ncbi:YodC family protein [Tardiphaga sp.]|uniref:YodC family protein n=1 Tax=Tardiphaga sp. TaxID=1926292 RepID=UPI0037DA46B5
MADFKEGDMVRVKSGGPTMTVNYIRPDEGREIQCVWFNHENTVWTVKYEVFNPNVLKKLD